MERFLTCVLLWLCAFERFCDSLTNGDGDGCISGFMSVDRMDALLDNTEDTMDSGNFQGIFPEVSFTCNGSIQRWVLGAKWEGHDEYIELQIWRLTGDGVYTKVGYTTINTTRSNSELYEYPLSPPLPFQAGDVLGYYQPEPSRSQLRVRFEQEGREPQRGYHYSDPTSPASVLNIPPGSLSDDRFQILVNVVTDPPGCGCGFMSVERMRYLLNVDTVSSLTVHSQRQQISPEMRFTCDGNITKWIIGAEYDNRDNLYPELQIWRNAGNETYWKINGTFIELQTPMSSRFYEYEDLIPVKSGDILGIFLPTFSSSRLRLLSELASSPAQYYLSLFSSPSSPYDEIDLKQDSVTRGAYHPLVSVEFVKAPTSSVMIIPSSSLVSTATSPLPTSRAHVPSTEQPSSSSGQSSAAIAAGVGGGVAVALVLLILVLVLVILVVFVSRRKLKGKPQAVEQGKDRDDGSAMDNPVYTATVSGAGPTIPLEELYDLPGRDQGKGDGVYDLPSENGGVYSEVTKTEEPPPSPGEYARFDNPLYDTT